MKLLDLVGLTWGGDVTEETVRSILPDAHAVEVHHEKTITTLEFQAGRVRLWLGDDDKIVALTYERPDGGIVNVSR